MYLCNSNVLNIYVSCYVDANSVFMLNLKKLNNDLMCHLDIVLKNSNLISSIELYKILIHVGTSTKKHFIIYTSPVAFKKRGKEELTLSKNLVIFEFFFKYNNSLVSNAAFFVFTKKIDTFLRTMGFVVNGITYNINIQKYKINL